MWYSSVGQARRVLKAWHGIAPSGRMAGLCEICGCHYSILDKKDFPDFACREWKEAVARGEYLPQKEEKP